MNPNGLRIGAASSVRNRRRSRTPAALALVVAGALACGFAAPAQAADGWQENSQFDVPAGRRGQQYGRNCPAGYNAVSGAFAFNAIGQEELDQFELQRPAHRRSNAGLELVGMAFLVAERREGR